MLRYILIIFIMLFTNGCIHPEKVTYKIKWDGQILEELANFQGDEDDLKDFIKTFEKIKFNRKVSFIENYSDNLLLYEILQLNNVSVNIYTENRQLNTLLLGKIPQRNLDKLTYYTYNKIYRVFSLGKNCHTIDGIPGFIDEKASLKIMDSFYEYFYQNIKEELKRNKEFVLEIKADKDFSVDESINNAKKILKRLEENNDTITKLLYTLKYSKKSYEQVAAAITVLKYKNNLEENYSKAYSFPKNKFPIKIECNYTYSVKKPLYRFSDRIEHDSGFNISKKIMQLRFMLGI